MSSLETSRKLEAGEKKDPVEVVRGFIESIAEELKERDNVPVRSDGRIDMAAFADVYDDVEKDIQRAKEWDQEWHPGVAAQDIAKDRMQSDGEKLEMLAHAMLHKNLGDRFIVVRSAPHDDRVNGVDNLLLDRETGELVCAFDEAVDIKNQEKQSAIFDKNMNQGGAKLKYGIGLEKKDGKFILKLERAEHLPLFHFSLPKRQMEKGIAEFIPEKGRQSDFEKQLFKYFLASMGAQIKEMEVFSKRLENQGVKGKFDAFKKAIESLSKKNGL